MNKFLFGLAIVVAISFSTETFAQDCGCGSRLQKQVGRVKTTVRNTTCRAKAITKNVVCEAHSVVARTKNRVKGMVSSNCCQPAATTTCCETTTNCCERVAVIPTVANWAMAPVRAATRIVRPCASGTCSNTTVTTVTETIVTPTATEAPSTATEAPSTATEATPSVLAPTPAQPVEKQN